MSVRRVTVSSSWFISVEHLVSLLPRNTTSSGKKPRKVEGEVKHVEENNDPFSTFEGSELDESEHSLHVTPKKSSILDPDVAKMESAKRRDEEEERQRESEIRKRRQQKSPISTNIPVAVPKTTPPRHVEESYSEMSSILDPEPVQQPHPISLDTIFFAVLVLILCILGCLCCRGVMMV